MSDPLPLKITGLRTAFGDTVIHDGLDLEVHKGEILGIVGGSGTGKSVLLNTILGLNTPTAGRVEIFGSDIHDTAHQVALKRRIGVMFQGGALFSSLSIQENIEAPLIEHTNLPISFVHELAALKIEMVGLPAETGNKHPSELSGGMKKRAGVARAIALDPELLFLDEPTAGLDPIGADEFDTLIRRLRSALGLTVFMITHDLDSLYANCDRVAVLADRKVVVVAPIPELEQSEHPWIKQYFRGPRGRAVQENRV